MKTTLFALTLLFIGTAHAETSSMIKCSGAGYTLDVMDNGYTFYTNARLAGKGSQIDLSCAVYTGKPDSAWNCSSDTGYDVVIFGQEWSQGAFPAKLSLGSRELATLECQAVN